MGKIEGTGNRPTNPSLSYTLPRLLSRVQLQAIGAGEDQWEPLSQEGWAAPALSDKGRSKFLRHFGRLKDQWGILGNWQIRSANNFPSDCGLASSASSFAALTMATAKAAGRATLQRDGMDLPGPRDADELSRLSRQGSGSSCRSMFSPWALWQDEGAEAIDLGYPDLLHAAVLVHAGVKSVSSSDAHLRVTTSPQFAGRPERATQRLRSLVAALKEKNWEQSYRLCWDEFNDMHELFETSAEPFGYRTEGSKNVVDACKHIWNFKKDGPLVTMDAGPNVHLLFRPDQQELAEKMVRHFKEKHMVLTSWSRFQ